MGIRIKKLLSTVGLTDPASAHKLKAGGVLKCNYQRKRRQRSQSWCWSALPQLCPTALFFNQMLSDSLLRHFIFFQKYAVNKNIIVLHSSNHFSLPKQRFAQEIYLNLIRTEMSLLCQHSAQNIGCIYITSVRTVIQRNTQVRSKDDIAA